MTLDNYQMYINGEWVAVTSGEQKEAFLEKLKARSQAIRLGPGLASPDTGTLVPAEQYERVLAYIDIGRAQGAQLVTGSGRYLHQRDQPRFAPGHHNSSRPDRRQRIFRRR
jgi:acyl-CoA reductase-like NAD-dependent aldehyde dehydrogenase